MPVNTTRIAYGIGIASVVAIVVVGGSIRNDKRAEAVEQFSVTKAELVMLDACEEAATEHEYKFLRRINAFTGCACAASEIANVTHERNFKAAADVIRRAVELGSAAEDDAFAMTELPRLEKKYQLSTAQATDLFETANTALSYCSTSEAYLSDEERELIRRQEEELLRHEEEVRIAKELRDVEERRTRASRDFREDTAYTPGERAEMDRRERQTDNNKRPSHRHMSESERREMFGTPPR